FWDLVVTEDRFEVGLSFGGIPERLVVPFHAIKSFFDPSVQFGLQFEPSEAIAETPASPKLPAAPAPAALAPAPVAAASAADDQPEPPAPSGEGAEVVRLDRFRKK
ncbi:ClpXP protease specificity-enhancing factor SspB, partial [Bradyrhizobium sp.]